MSNDSRTPSTIKTMNRFESCPLNRNCQKSEERFYRHKKDLRGCKNYWECRILSSAWKFPIEEHYNSHGQYIEVCTEPIISEWYEISSYFYPEVQGKNCRVRFLALNQVVIGSWFHRSLELPQAKDLEACDFLELEQSVAMEIEQAHYRMGFCEAVPIKKRK